MARKPGRMADLGNKTFDRTNAELSDEEAKILLETNIDWEALRPKISDQEIYNRLIHEVQAATQKNENLAQLKDRLSTLGKEGLSVAKKIAQLVP